MTRQLCVVRKGGLGAGVGVMLRLPHFRCALWKSFSCWPGALGPLGTAKLVR